jgi:microcystin-dependent protein
MADPFIGEIKLIPWNYPPKGWAFCNGQVMSIAQNQPLYSLLGTTYGGDGITTFKLPDLRGRAATHFNNSNMPLGGSAGEAGHVLSATETPAHAHNMGAANIAGNIGTVAAGNWLAGFPGYVAPVGAALTSLDPSTIGTTGAGQAHENRQPFLCLTYAIALQGIYPSRP